MKGLYFNDFGGAEVLQYGELPDPEIKSGQALVRMHAVGLNFADIYRRRGNYHLAGEPPFILGYEGAGEIIASERVSQTELSVGDRVAFADSPFANAELVAVDLEKLVKLPAAISYETAAATMLQGLTAHYLTNDSHSIKPGETAVVHAAAGGVGLLLTQIIKLKGGKVLAVISGEAKRVAALDAGADAAVLYDEEWVVRAEKFGRDENGVDVVFDSVGTTLDASLAAARKGGQVVFYGMAGGDPEKVDPRRLMDESKTVTGGDLWNVLTSGEERGRRTAELFSWISESKLKVRIARRFPLAEGKAAHEFLASRAAIGKVLLIP
ncbi:MAG: quinone oxidoreductase [Pyrinomonadaceae bacterium]|nr:quinone oxidoreductase [Pyrinomonadaceae bacterium]